MKYNLAAGAPVGTVGTESVPCRYQSYTLCSDLLLCISLYLLACYCNFVIKKNDNENFLHLSIKEG